MAEYTTETIDLTPDKARELVRWNTHNRRVRPRKVEQFAEAMKAGNWDSLADPGITLARLPDGRMRLLNGQHRLTAVVASGVTIAGIAIRVAEMTEEEADASYANFDQGANRHVADVLGAVGDAPQRDLGVVATALAMIELLPQGHRVMSNATVADRVRIFREHPEETAFGLRLRAAVRVGGKPLPTGMVMAGIEMFRVDQEYADEFWTQVGEGTLLMATDPTFHLRELLLRGNTRPGGSGTTKVLRQRVQALTAWRAFVRREKISRIQIKADVESYASFPVERPKVKREETLPA